MAPHRGHLHDSERTREPPYISQPLPIQADTWRRWVRDIGTADSERELVSSTQLEAEFGSYASTYDYGDEKHHRGQHGRRRRRPVWEIFTEDPWVPGVLRIIMFGLSALTLGLGARLVFLNTHLGPGDMDFPVCEASPAMAVALAALAIAYLPYIFYDEYFGGPVGVRSPLSKARLLFFDLTFVVLYAVNATLAADEAFTDGCTSAYMVEHAVFALVLVTLVAWIGTFSITLIRLIARIGANIRTGRT